MRDATTPKQKLTTKIFHIISFVVLLFYIFLLISQFKVLIECFSSNQFDEIEHVLKFGSNKNVSNLVVYIIKFI